MKKFTWCCWHAADKTHDAGSRVTSESLDKHSHTAPHPPWCYCVQSQDLQIINYCFESRVSSQNRNDLMLNDGWTEENPIFYLFRSDEAETVVSGVMTCQPLVIQVSAGIVFMRCSSDHQSPSAPPPALFLIIRDSGGGGECSGSTQLKFNKGAAAGGEMCATTFVISASVTPATFPRLFSFLISSLDSLASLISSSDDSLASLLLSASIWWEI